MQAEFNSLNGHLLIQSPDTPGIPILDGMAWVRYRSQSGKLSQVNLSGAGCSITEGPIEDIHGQGRQLIVHQTAGVEGLELTYHINHYTHQPFILLRIFTRNAGKEPIFLQAFCLLQAETRHAGRVNFPGDAGSLRFFKVGWHGWAYSGLRYASDRKPGFITNLLTGTSYTNPVTPRPGKAGEFWSEGWGVLANEQHALVAGFVTTAHQFGQVYVCIRPGEEAFQLSTQLDDVRLDPGEEKESEWGYLQLLPLPNPEPAADFVLAVSREMKPRVPPSPPALMWTHWYRFYHDISEQLFLQNLESLAALHSTLPFHTVELDDGYQSAWGDWTTTNKKFPNGLDQLAANIQRKGFTPGLWVAPFAVHMKSQLARQHPDWLLKDQAGKPIQAGFLYDMFISSLDGSHPAALEHTRDLMAKVTNQWGYRMIKADFLNTAALPGRHYNPKLTRAECLRLGLEAIREGIGDEVFLLGCGCPLGPAIGIVDAMRIGPDTAPSWEPFFHWLPSAKPLIKKETSMPSLRNALRHTMNLNTLNQRWWWNDPDCLLVRDRETSLSEEEVKSMLTLVGLSGGMLVSSDDLRTINPRRLECLSLLVPNLGLRGLPVDWLENEMAGLFHVPMPGTPGGKQGWHLIGLFNWQDHPADVPLPLKKLGLENSAALHVFDFWSRSYKQVNQDVINSWNIPAHGCKLLRICEVGASPRIVGDTLHISQGAEFAYWQAGEHSLKMDTIDFGRQVEGEIWLALPANPAAVTLNHTPVETAETFPGIYTLLSMKFNRTGRLEITY